MDGENIILKDQVLEARLANADSRLHVARKTKAPDDWDPPMPVYDHMALACRATMM